LHKNASDDRANANSNSNANTNTWKKKSKEHEAKITRQNMHNIDPRVWGTVLEPVARQHLEQSTQSMVGLLGLRVHPTFPYIGASPDGIQIKDGKPRLIEIKCPKTRQITYQVPLEYWVQMQIAMEVWDIDETLYCEYKFDLAQEKPTVKDFTVIYGELSPGVFWIYQSRWLYTIQRDKSWFNSIKCQIVNFYHLKFNTNPRGPPGTGSEGSDGSNALQIGDAMDTSDTSSMSTTPVTTPKNRKRKRDTEDVTNKRGKSNNSKVISKKESTDIELMPISRLTNYLNEDPIVDWLNNAGYKGGYQMDKSRFLEFYNQKNLRFKMDVIRKCITKAKEWQLKYRILNMSVNNVLDIYENNILLKIQYDCHLIEDTQNAMKEGMDLIFMGQLGRTIKDNEGKDRMLWETFDLLIRREIFEYVFGIDGIGGNRHLLKDWDENMTHQYPDYIPMKFKLTTVDLRSDFTLGYKHKNDKIMMGSITSSMLLDRYDRIGLVPFDKQYDSIIKDGMAWLNKLPETSLADLYPNMKNKHDSPWHSAKEIIATNKEELTQVSYLSVKTRDMLHKKGIKRISQLTPDMAEDLPYGNKISCFVSKELYLPPLDLQPQPVEVYLDFESVSNLGGEQLIFLMGILVKRGQQMDYKPFLIHNLKKKYETRMLEEGLELLRSLGPNIPIFHWSHAEPTMLNTAGFELPDNCYWVDLYKHLLDNHATIPGAYGYGLKPIGKRLYEMGKVQSKWLYGLDGTEAMVMAWNIQHKCDITGEKFKDDARIKKLCTYNFVDCQVMEEIRRLL
jgi:hypothetical protein